MNSLKDALDLVASESARYAAHLRDHVDIDSKGIKKLDGNCEFCLSHIKGVA